MTVPVTEFLPSYWGECVGMGSFMENVLLGFPGGLSEERIESIL